jgi:tetratricopeptide (TPR) repeat protein
MIETEKPAERRRGEEPCRSGAPIRTEKPRSGFGVLINTMVTDATAKRGVARSHAEQSGLTRGGGEHSDADGALIKIALCLSSWLVLSLLPASAQYRPPTLKELLKAAEQAAQAAPRDAKKRYEWADYLRKSGDFHNAAIEYLDVTVLDPTYYVAYHQLLDCKPTDDQLDEAIERLTKVEVQRPKELMLRVALSEVLEKRGETYKAARALVDLQFAEYIPPKYTAQINARVRYLLGKSRDAQTAEKAHQATQPANEDSDSTPLPLPENSGGKDFSTAKLKDSGDTDGNDHTKAQP